MHTSSKLCSPLRSPLPLLSPYSLALQKTIASPGRGIMAMDGECA